MRRKSAKISVSADDDIDDMLRNIDDEIEEIIHPGLKLKLAQEQENKVKKAQIDRLLQEQSKAKKDSSQITSRTVKSNGDTSSGLDQNKVGGDQLIDQSKEKEQDVDDDENEEDEDEGDHESQDEASREARKEKEDTIRTEEKSIADNVTKIVTTLTTQIEEFKLRFKEATAKLWAEEDRNADLEGKIEILEEEKISLLEAKVRAIEAAASGRTFRPVQDVKHVNTASKNLRGEAIRRGLLFDDYEESGPLDDLYNVGAGGLLIALIKALIIKLTPFRRDIKQINGQFGSSVASYFIFYRFIFLQSMFIAGVAAIFIGFHINTMVDDGNTSIMTVQSTHVLPKFMNPSSFKPSEALIYATVVIAGILLSSSVIMYKYLVEDMNSKESISTDNEHSYTYANNCFCAWDNSLRSSGEANDHSGSLIQLYSLLLSETHSKYMKDMRSNSDVLYMSARRMTGTFLYLLVQAIAFFIIIYVSVNNGNITDSLEKISDFVGIPGLSNIAALVSPAVLTLINSATPLLFTKITILEKWDNAAVEVEILLIRLFVSSTANLLLLSFSYALLASPFLLGAQPEIRAALAITYSPVYTCRLDQVANGLFTLVLFTFIIKMVTMIMLPVGKMYLFNSIGKTYVKEEFKVAERIVETLHLISVVALSFPFAPLAIIFLPIFLFINFKWEKFTVSKFYSKPKRPWKAHKAGTVFTTFYLFSLILIGIPSAIFFLATPGFSKNCSIQDNNINLCLSAVDSITKTCTTNTENEFYELYGRGSRSTYPASICQDSCGAFVDIDGAHILVLWEVILTIEPLSIIFQILFFYPYLPWVLVIILIVTSIKSSNSTIVDSTYSYNKERSLNARIQVLELEIKKQVKISTRMRSIARVTDDVISQPSNTLDQKLNNSIKIKPLKKVL